MFFQTCRVATLLLLLIVGPVQRAAAQEASSGVETAWRLLDYIAVDYGGAVAHGQVSSASEYAEQTEFAATVAAKIGAMPDTPARRELQQGAQRLRAAVRDKADPAQVADIARGLARALLMAYPVPLAPNRPPTFERGAALYEQNCAACHGVTGNGQGPAASALATQPVAFVDHVRARQRSVFALYQVITQGIDGTPMASFSRLPADDRWALAFYAGHFAFPDDSAKAGESLWKSDATLYHRIPDLKTLAALTPAELEHDLGDANGSALTAYLRRHPEVVASQQAKPARSTDSLALVRDRLAQSLAASRAGDRARASDLALSAYLDGFEPVEPTLGARNAALLAHIEGAMGDYRGAIQRGDEPEALARRAQVLNQLFDDAAEAMSPTSATNASTFLGAAAILLREGVEALLIVVAMIAFLRKAERPEVLPYVHGGWIGALAAGAATWAIATWMIGISGANRELVEGFGSVFASVVLLWVGIWMHGKAQADQWQIYIREKMSRALTGRSAWLLFGLAFIVVYREVFETILFYAALWNQGNGGAMLGGAGSACLALALIAWAVLRCSRKLPVTQFFRYSSWLMGILTVVLIGKGLAALQEAGLVDIAPLPVVPRFELVGLFPTMQTIAAQVLVALALFFGFRRNRPATSS